MDKNDLRIPYSASFRPNFRFVAKELQYAGFSSTVKPSRHYQGVVDLRPFGLDAILHAYYKAKGPKNHKLELLHTGTKTLSQMAQTITSVFDVDPFKLAMMRIDFAADMHDILVENLHQTLRVRFKRTSDCRGELDYEIVGKRRFEYFRYGTAPNCVRVYDKPAECKARFPRILKGITRDKRATRDVKLPTFEQTFGFPETAVITRVERQAGGSGIPNQLATFGQLRNAADFNPFTAVEILPNSFPLPDPAQYCEAEIVKLLGTHALIQQYGFQTARAILNRNGNAKRYTEPYEGYRRSSERISTLTVDSIVKAYRDSVSKQIDIC